jgi:hypothetical protein
VQQEELVIQMKLVDTITTSLMLREKPVITADNGMVVGMEPE